jgi:hypothetical protein
VQATQRQRQADSVYVAVLRPPALRADKRHRAVLHLLRRLELGLLFVTTGRRPRVEVVLHPEPFSQRKDRAKRRSLLEEAASRSRDWNRGGSTRRPLVTAYRERALHCAALLERIGPASPARLRALGTCENTRSIVYGDVYGWFSRTGFASYELAPAGREALSQFADVVASLRERVDAAFASATASGDAARETAAARRRTRTGERRRTVASSAPAATDRNARSAAADARPPSPSCECGERGQDGLADQRCESPRVGSLTGCHVSCRGTDGPTRSARSAGAAKTIFRLEGRIRSRRPRASRSSKSVRAVW